MLRITPSSFLRQRTVTIRINSQDDMHQFKKENGRKKMLVISGEKQLMSSYKKKMETLAFTAQLEKNPNLRFKKTTQSRAGRQLQE